MMILCVIHGVMFCITVLLRPMGSKWRNFIKITNDLVQTVILALIYYTTNCIEEAKEIKSISDEEISHLFDIGWL